MLVRGLLFILGFGLLFTIPWWAMATLLVAGMIIFPSAYELVGLVFIMELMYGIHTTEVPTHTFFLWTIGALLLVTVLDELRSRLTLYQ